MQVASRIRHHPVLRRETAARAASAVTPVALTVFLGTVAAVAGILFSLAAVGSPDQRPGAGQLERVAYHTMSLQLALAVLMAAALGAEAISDERERATWDLLRVGQLGPRSLAMAKLAAVVAYVGLFAAAALPLYVAVFGHSGLGLGQLAVAEVLTVVAAAGAAAVGLLLGALCSRPVATLAAAALCLALLLDVALSGLVPAPASGLPQTASQLVAGMAGADTTEVVTDAQGVPLPARRPRLHLLRLANPLYAMHRAITDPRPAIDPGGVPVARAVRSLVPGDTSWSTWGPRLAPWQYSVALSVALTWLLLLATARAVSPGRRRRHPTSPPVPGPEPAPVAVPDQAVPHEEAAR